MKHHWKHFFIKYFDFNRNKHNDWWEVAIPFVLFIILEIILGVISNFIYTIL